MYGIGAGARRRAALLKAVAPDAAPSFWAGPRLRRASRKFFTKCGSEHGPKISRQLVRTETTDDKIHR